MPYRVKPTSKQKVALNLLKLNLAMTPTEAMRQAGYSKKSLRSPGRILFGARGVLQAQEEWAVVLARHGIDANILGAKYAELLEAKKVFGTGDNFIEVPDHDTQLKTVEILKRDLGLSSQTQDKNEEKTVTFVWRKPANQ